MIIFTVMSGKEFRMKMNLAGSLKNSWPRDRKQSPGRMNEDYTSLIF
jgi:hypothetical protein